MASRLPASGTRLFPRGPHAPRPAKKSPAEFSPNSTSGEIRGADRGRAVSGRSRWAVHTHPPIRRDARADDLRPALAGFARKDVSRRPPERAPPETPYRSGRRRQGFQHDAAPPLRHDHPPLGLHRAAPARQRASIARIRRCERGQGPRRPHGVRRRRGDDPVHHAAHPR